MLRGTIPPGETQGTHLLAAYVPERGMVLMQVEVDGKANEKSIAPRLLEAIDLQRVVKHHQTGKITYEVLFGITSQTSDRVSPDILLHHVRQHWHIENRLHYVRDVTFREDACTIRHTKRQRLMASLNNLVIGLVRQTDFRYLPEARRYFSANYHEALNFCFSHFAKALIITGAKLALLPQMRY